MKSSLKRVTHYAGALLFAGALVGCGDDGGGNDVDAGGGGADAGADAAPEVDAAPCTGHGCAGIDSPFQLAEGGEFRLERLQLDNANDFVLASQAFFFTGQEPASRPLGDPALVIPIRQELTMQGYRCTDRRGGRLFENGASPEGQMIADTREYYDVGEEVTLTNTDDAADVITMDRRMNDVDLSASLMHDIIYRGPDGQDVERNRTYKPDIDGSAEYPLLDLKFGQSVVGQELADESGVGDPLLYMPSQFELTSPTEDVFFDAEGITFTKGQDVTFTYTTSETTPDGWPTVLLFVAFVNADAQVVASCLKAPTAAGPPDNGTFVMPYEVLDILDEEEPGRFLVGRFAHTAWEYQSDKTRIDMMGIDCKAAPSWKIEEAPAN